MSGIQESKEKNIKIKSTRTFRDLILLAAIIILVLIFSYFFDAFIIIVKFLQKYPSKIAYVDEVITGLLTISIGLAVFAWRRWLELKKETAEHIKLQEQLITIAETKAETTSIICNVLRSEIEYHRKHNK